MNTAARLGFGCSSLGSEIGYRESCAVVEAAYEAGFRHFDVAPSYGRGQAERIVGDVLTPVRNQITLVSKAGIAHPRGSAAVLALRGLVLPLKRRFPGLWKGASRGAAQAMAPAGRFGVEEVRASLDESLRRLRTDRLDALLLHEVQLADVNDSLLRALQDLRAGGRVGAIGTGTGVAASLALLQRWPGAFDWVQTHHYWGAFEVGLQAAPRLLLHRSLRTGLALVRAPAFVHAAELENPELLPALQDVRSASALLLRAALQQAGPAGVVLVSSTRVARQREWLDAVAQDTSPALTAALNGAFLRCRPAIQRPEDCTP